jgi:hypothetical protein
VGVQRLSVRQAAKGTAAALLVVAGMTAQAAEPATLTLVVEKVLNHVTPGIAGVYQHHNWLEEKRDAMEKLADLIAKIVEGNTAAK